MKYVLLIFSSWIISLSAFTQKSDYIWLSGYNGYPHPIYDPSDSFYFATTILNFNYSPLQIEMDSLQMNFSRTNTSFCDSNGNLLFYTNGIYVANRLDSTI